MDALVQMVAQQIETYLKQHPNAADTAEGIAQQWLGRTTQYPLAVVRKALERLVERCVVEREHGKGGDIVYRKHRAA